MAYSRLSMSKIFEVLRLSVADGRIPVCFRHGNHAAMFREMIDCCCSISVSHDLKLLFKLWLGLALRCSRLACPLCPSPSGGSVAQSIATASSFAVTTECFRCP